MTRQVLAVTAPFQRIAGRPWPSCRSDAQMREYCRRFHVRKELSMKRMGAVVLGLVVLLAASLPLAAQTPGKAWSEKWKAENKRWVAFHLMGVKPDRLDAVQEAHRRRACPAGVQCPRSGGRLRLPIQVAPGAGNQRPQQGAGPDAHRGLPQARHPPDPADELPRPSVLGRPIGSIAQEVSRSSTRRPRFRKTTRRSTAASGARRTRT